MSAHVHTSKTRGPRAAMEAKALALATGGKKEKERHQKTKEAKKKLAEAAESSAPALASAQQLQQELLDEVASRRICASTPTHTHARTRTHARTHR